MSRNSTRLWLLVAATLFFSSVFPNPAPAQTVSFIARVDYAVGANPASVAVGDFNGDGVPDLAVANYGANTVSVLLGNSDGTFQAALTFATEGFNPEFVAVGDVNRDGRLDLAVAHSGSTLGTVAVLLGNGDGTFQAPRNFSTGQGSLSVAVGDVNGDGQPDLAVANYYSNDVSVLLGNGDGSFQATQSFATAGPNPVTVAMSDVNGDGRPDLAVTNSANTTSGAMPGNISVLLGNGNGTFQPARTIDVGITPAFVAVRDVNGDGRPDLAVANFRSNTVSVLLGNGDGIFQAPRNFDAGTGPLSFAVGDVNGDRVPDLAVANYDFNIQGPNTVSVLLGNGDGTFQPAQAFGAGTNPASVAMGDVNGDGRPDLAVANFNSNNVSVLINNTALARNTLTITKAGTGSGTVTSNPPGINCGATCSAAYNSGTVVSLTATPATGSTFTGWSGCDAVSGTTCTVSMSAARSVTVTFTRQTFTLTVSKTGLIASGTVTSNPPGINCGATCSAAYNSGTVVTLTATPGFLSIFSGWSGCDAVSGTTCFVTMSAARSVTANFLP
jgi:VCBS repeat protein/List-Bact-rpt repeat protein